MLDANRQSYPADRLKEIFMVTLNDARNIIAAAEKKAIEIRQPMNIAVADTVGNLVALGKIVLMVRNPTTLS